MSRWNSLYLPLDDSASVVTALRTLLTAPAYAPYDPFGLMPGMSYPQAVKLFVAPSSAGWTRVIAAADTPNDALQSIQRALSKLAVCFALVLDNGESQIAVYADNAGVDPISVLTPYLRGGVTSDLLGDALTRPYKAANPKDSPIPTGALPSNVQSMAGRLNPRQVNNLFNRMSKQLVGKEQREAAQSLLVAAAPDWDSAGGQRIAAVMACLTIPPAWRDPDYVTLRDAYQSHSRIRRNPNARLYPGDADTMAAVPDALAYVPVFAGLVG